MQRCTRTKTEIIRTVSYGNGTSFDGEWVGKFDVGCFLAVVVMALLLYHPNLLLQEK